VKFFQKLLVAPATIAIALAPNLNGFAKESNKSDQEKNQSINKSLIAQVRNDEESTLKISVTGTKSPREIKNVPSAVNVIDKKTIDSQGIKDLKSLLKYDPAVEIKTQTAGSYYGGYGQGNVNIRGMESNRVLMMRDNVNLPKRYEFSSSLGRADYVDLNTLKSVEILKGPASTLYGSDALGGVITYRSLYPEDLLNANETFKVEIPAIYDGSDNTVQGAIRVAVRDENSDIEGVVVLSKSTGEELNAKADKKYINENENSKQSIYTNIVKNINEYTRLNLIYENVDKESETISKKDNLSSSYSGVKEDRDITRSMLNLGYEYDNADSSKFFNYAKINLFSQQSDFSDDSIIDYASSVSRRTGALTPAYKKLNDDDLEDEKKGINLQLKSEITSGGLTNKFTYGIDYSDTFNSKSNKDTEIRSGTTTINSIKHTPDSDTEEYGIYVQNEMTWENYENVELIAGLRYDHYSLSSTNDADYKNTMDGRGKTDTPANIDDSSLNPHLSLLYKLTPEVTAYGKYSRAFRAPTYAEVNNAHGNIFHGYYVLNNPDLESETSDNYEVGIKGDYPKFDFSLVSFISKIDNKIDGYKEITTPGAGNDCIAITGRPCQVLQHQNLDEAEIWGLEWTSEYNFNENKEGFSLLGSFAYTYGDDTSTSEDKALLSINPFKAILGLKYTAKNNKWTSELLNTYVGTARTPEEYDDNPHSSYSVVDFNNNFNVNERLGLDFGIYNLFDKKYYNYSTVRTQDASDTNIERFAEAGRHIKAGFNFVF